MVEVVLHEPRNHGSPIYTGGLLAPVRNNSLDGTSDDRLEMRMRA